MPDHQPRATAAGGFPIAIGVLGGAVLGFIAGQPTIGLLIGAAGGIAISAALWWRDHRA